VSPAHILISFLTGIAGGFIGGVTGGAGVLSIPVLIFLGLRADAAIATNTLTGFGLIAASLPRYSRAKQVRWRTGLKLIPLGALGGFIGATELVRINPDTLSVVVGILLLLMIPVILLNSEKGLKASRPGVNQAAFGYCLYFLIMVYGGFVGAGAGVFSLYTLVYFFGMTYIEAKGTISVPGLFLTAAAFIIFQTHGLVNYKLGLPMMAGMYIGADLGARTALKRGNAWVRVFLVVVTIASSVKLPFFP
jgi:uncharacterized protein